MVRRGAVPGKRQGLTLDFIFLQLPDFFFQGLQGISALLAPAGQFEQRPRVQAQILAHGLLSAGRGTKKGEHAAHAARFTFRQGIDVIRTNIRRCGNQPHGFGEFGHLGEGGGYPGVQAVAYRIVQIIDFQTLTIFVKGASRRKPVSPA